MRNIASVSKKPSLKRKFQKKIDSIYYLLGYSTLFLIIYNRCSKCVPFISIHARAYLIKFLNTLHKVGTLISCIFWVIWLFNSFILANLMRNTRCFEKDHRKKSSGIKCRFLAGHQPLEIKRSSKNSFNRAIVDCTEWPCALCCRK